MVTALMVRPGEHPSPTQLCDNNDFLNRVVSLETDTVCSAAAIRLHDGIAVLFNQNAALMEVIGNRRVGQWILAGTFYVIGVKDGRLVSLTDDELTRYMVRFWEPEYYTDNEVFLSGLDAQWSAMGFD